MSGEEKVRKELYNDLIKPSAKPLGETLSIIPRVVRIKLQPIEKWLIQEEHNYKRTMELLAKKLEQTDPELIDTPEAYIAVPALQYLGYCIDNEALREMYANLLANSMNKLVKNGVHPAFVEIIKQLCPDEAKILREMSKWNTMPTLSVRFEASTGEGMCYLNEFSDIGEYARCEQPYEIKKYFDNLVRLGLLERAPQYTRLAFDGFYELLMEHPIVKEAAGKLGENHGYYREVKYEKSSISLTEFGKAFCNVCIGRVVPTHSELLESIETMGYTLEELKERYGFILDK